MLVSMSAGVLAQAGVDTSSIFIQYGAIGLIALLALGAVRVLFQREVKALDLERQRADRLENELRLLNSTVQERYMTVLGEATRVMSDVLETTKDRPR